MKKWDIKLLIHHFCIQNTYSYNTRKNYYFSYYYYRRKT